MTKEKRSLKVGLCQFQPKLGRVGDNVKAILAVASRARARRLDLVVFPELAVTGYFLKDLVPEVAIRDDGPEARALARASRGMGLLVGAVEESSDHRFFNSAFYFEDGRLRALHRKVYLPTYGLFDEGRDLAPGDRIRALPSRFGPLGVMICEDAWHPTTAQVLAMDGAQILITLSSSPARGFPRGKKLPTSARRWALFGSAQAGFFTTPFLYCNRTGFEDGIAFAGGSFATDASGDMILEPRGRESGLHEVRISLADIRSARAASPLLRDERTSLVQEEWVRLRAGNPS